MHDVQRAGPDRAGLFQLAATQKGFFTAAQAHANGYSRSLLAHHARTGTLQRVSLGVYRFRDYPAEPHEDVMAAWLAIGRERAVVSHVSALDLWGLSDLIPDAVHLSVPRAHRHFPRLPGVVIHTTTRPLAGPDIRVREGLRVTSPERTILDVTEAGAAPDQVELAIRQALDRGWLERVALRPRAAERGTRVLALAEGALSMTTGHA